MTLLSRSEPSVQVSAPVWRASAQNADDALKALGDYLVGLHGPQADAIGTMREFIHRAGGDHLPAPLFRAILLDIADCAARVPPSTWLGLCRGLALGASLRGQGLALPLPLHHAARSLLQQLPIRPSRRVAMAQALML